MSNLNDTFEQLQVFLRSLREFNEAIRLSAAELAESDEQITALWDDDAAVRYRGVYDPLAESLRSYLAADASRFEHFIETKVTQFDDFLHGE
jgi:hypothetical protein